MLIDVKKVKEEAEKEFVEERMKSAKDKVKAKLKQLADAKRIVTNLELELEDIYADLGTK